MISVFYHVIAVQMQAGDPVVGAPMGVTGTQSRSEDEDTLVIKDVKRTVTQAFGSGVPKRRSSNRSELNFCFMLFLLVYTKLSFDRKKAQQTIIFAVLKLIPNWSSATFLLNLTRMGPLMIFLIQMLLGLTKGIIPHSVRLLWHYKKRHWLSPYCLCVTIQVS